MLNIDMRKVEKGVQTLACDQADGGEWGGPPYFEGLALTDYEPSGRLIAGEVYAEDVRNLTDDQITALGYTSLAAFLRYWIKEHNLKSPLINGLYSSIRNESVWAITHKDYHGDWAAWLVELIVKSDGPQ